MGTITGYTAEFIDAVLDGTIAGAAVVGGDLILTRTNGTTFNAGSVIGPTGDIGLTGPTSIEIVTSATRPGSPVEGLFIYETDTDRFYSWNGTFWVERGIGMIICTNATRPTSNLFTGMFIYETDTKRKYVYDGSGWMYLGGAAPPVIAPSLLNSWVNFGAPWLPAGYWKDAGGTVHLEGLVKNGTTTTGTPIFALPAGYRPAGDVSFIVRGVEGTSQGAASLQIISSSGQVQVVATTGFTAVNDALALDGITFRAA